MRMISLCGKQSYLEFCYCSTFLFISCLIHLLAMILILIVKPITLNDMSPGLILMNLEDISRRPEKPCSSAKAYHQLVSSCNCVNMLRSFDVAGAKFEKLPEIKFDPKLFFYKHLT